MNCHKKSAWWEDLMEELDSYSPEEISRSEDVTVDIRPP